MAEPQVLIRELNADDEFAFLRAVRESRSLHGEWISPPATPREFMAHLRRCRRADTYCYLIVEVESGEPAGYAMLTNIIRRAFESAFLGFGAFAGHEGRGRMCAGLSLVLDEAFGPLGLHRVEANVQPGNERSTALVERLGFRYEGHSPNYLRVAGAWRDHDRWAITLEDDRPDQPPFRPGRASRSGGARR